MLSTVRTGDTMIVIEEIEDGVYKVTVTDQHREILDRCSKKTSIEGETILSLWIGCGMNTMAASL